MNEGQSTELVGRPGMWRNEIPECCFQNTLVRFQVDRARLVPEFALAVMLNYFHRGVLARISSKTSNVAHLGASRFANLTMIEPPLRLQSLFAERFDAVRSIIRQQDEALAKAQAAFSAILATPFSPCAVR